MNVRVSDLPLPVNDITTENGTYTIQVMSVKEYLESVGIFNAKTGAIKSVNEIETGDFQRRAIAIGRNKIKRKMFRDLICGATLPTVVLSDEGEGKRPSIIDGVQRTDVQQLALTTLTDKNSIEDRYGDWIMEDVVAVGDKIISRDKFLSQRIPVQVWHGLTHSEKVRLFMTLNVGQQKIAPRHLLEVMGSHLREMFESEWGVVLVSSKDEQAKKEQAGKKGVKVSDLGFRFEYLLDGVIAYISCDPQIKTTNLVGKGGVEPDFDRAVEVLGEESVKSDFLWVINDLRPLIQSKYSFKDYRHWHLAIDQKVTFFVPLMAALGWARKNQRGNTGSSATLDAHKKALIQQCQDVEHDPLCLVEETNENSFTSVEKRFKSNLGRRTRNMAFMAWREYFRIGSQNDKMPIDWPFGAASLPPVDTDGKE